MTKMSIELAYLNPPMPHPHHSSHRTSNSQAKQFISKITNTCLFQLSSINNIVNMVSMNMTWMFVVFLAVVAAAPTAKAAVNCTEVESKFAPCTPYLQNQVSTPSSSCCDALKSLNAAATTTADRRALCKCLTSAVQKTPNLNYFNAINLPGKCRFDSSLISFNCDRYIFIYNFLNFIFFRKKVN